MFNERKKPPVVNSYLDLKHKKRDFYINSVFLKPKQCGSSSKCLPSEMCCNKHRQTTVPAAAWRREHYKRCRLHMKSAWWFAASLQRLQRPSHFQGEGVLSGSFRAQKQFAWVLSEIQIYTTSSSSLILTYTHRDCFWVLYVKCSKHLL